MLLENSCASRDRVSHWRETFCLNWYYFFYSLQWVRHGVRLALQILIDALI